MGTTNSILSQQQQDKSFCSSFQSALTTNQNDDDNGVYDNYDDSNYKVEEPPSPQQQQQQEIEALSSLPSSTSSQQRQPEQPVDSYMSGTSNSTEESPTTLAAMKRNKVEESLVQQQPYVDYSEPCYDEDDKDNNDQEAPLIKSQWTPVQANYPIEEGAEEKYPFLKSIVTMRGIKGYVNDESLLPQTTYSFLVSTCLWSSTHVVTVFVFALQVGSYLAVAGNIFDRSHPINRGQIPANVSMSVRACQFLSLVYSVLVQNGIIQSLYTFRNGYDEMELRRCFPGCSRSSIVLYIRWCFGLSLILLMGCVAQFLTFVLIMQSEDVLGVLLNYAAVSFIATIDDRVFYLGKRGWLGSDIERHVRLVALADNVDPKPPVWYRRLAHSITMVFLFGLLVGLWVTVVDHQTSGKFLYKTIRVEFSDLVNPHLGTFSGFYARIEEETRVFSTSHSIYKEVNSGKAFFGYCSDIEAWTFSYNIPAGNEHDACKWHARSSETRKFDLVTTTTSQWFAKKQGDGRIIPMDGVSITGWSCQIDKDLCGPNGKCSDDAQFCECDEGYYGIKCEFPEPCNVLETDKRYGAVRPGRDWSTKYEILRFNHNNKTAKLYDHPVYITHQDFARQFLEGDEFFRSTFQRDILFFTGRRWALSILSSFYNGPDGPEDSAFESYLDNFHAHFSDYEVTFLSEPIDSIKDNPSPDGLKFFDARPKMDSDGIGSGNHTHKNGIQTALTVASSAVLICVECDPESNPCLFDGVCNEESRSCDCSEGSTGGLCEVPPVGNGRCDPYFNDIKFAMDGGDCCRATCVNSDDNICGKDDTGFLDTGFFFCENDDPIPSETIRGEAFSHAGRKIAISDNAFVMAAEMAEGKVGIFDKVGSHWNERYVINTIRNCPIQGLAMASGPFASNPIFLPPVVIVISCKGTATVQSFLCTKNGCSSDTLENPPQDQYRIGDSIGISSDGGTIAVSSRGNEAESGYVDILRAEEGDRGSIVWKRNNETIIPEKYRIPGIPPTPADGSPPRAPNNTTSSDQSSNSTFIDEGENATLVPSASPTLEPTSYPSSSPTITPSQVVVAMSLSGNGEALAMVVGDIVNNLTVTIFAHRFNGIEWLQQGDTIQEILCSREIRRESIIRLSSDGNALLLSNGNVVKVFDWNGVAKEWACRGKPLRILPEVHSLSCFVDNVALSADGNVVAINTYNPNKEERSSNENEHFIVTFWWTSPSEGDEPKWERREEHTLPGSSEGPVALSDRGSELLVGLPLVAADLSGAIQSYEYPQLPCKPGFDRIRVTFTIKPKITRWTLNFWNQNNETGYVEGGPYFFPDFPNAEKVRKTLYPQATVVEEICVPQNLCANLTIYPTNFGGFNAVKNGVIAFFRESSDEPITWSFNNCLSSR